MDFVAKLQPCIMFAKTAKIEYSYISLFVTRNRIRQSTQISPRPPLGTMFTSGMCTNYSYREQQKPQTQHLQGLRCKWD